MDIRGGYKMAQFLAESRSAVIENFRHNRGGLVNKKGQSGSISRILSWPLGEATAIIHLAL